jgi:hypothetical protein
METREFIIDDENAKIRVDKAVASLLDFSRRKYFSEWKSLQGKLYIAGRGSFVS